MPPLEKLEQTLRRAIALPGAGSSDFDLNAGQRPGGTGALRPAGVLIPILSASRQVILTKRSSALKHHPGQVAFPGGKVDPGDADPVAAALREAEEEIGLSRTRPRVLGSLPSHETVTRFDVTPVVALIEDVFDPVPEAGEVEEVFAVPLDHLLDPANYRVQSRTWQGQPRYFYTVPYGPYYIWGATARMLRQLADRVAQCS